MLKSNLALFFTCRAVAAGHKSKGVFEGTGDLPPSPHGKHASRVRRRRRPTNWERCATRRFPKRFQAWDFVAYSGVDGAIMLGKGSDVLAAPLSGVTLVPFGTAPVQTFPKLRASPRSCVCVYLYMCV